jgi:hypothetical protein
MPALHGAVEVLHDDVSRILDDMGGHGLNGQGQTYEELRRRMEELEAELAAGEAKRSEMSEMVRHKQEAYQRQLDELREQVGHGGIEIRRHGRKIVAGNSDPAGLVSCGRRPGRLLRRWKKRALGMMSEHPPWTGAFPPHLLWHLHAKSHKSLAYGPLG